AVSAMPHGWALAHQGRAQEGAEQLTHSLSAFGAAGGEIMRPYYLALLADAQGTLGKPATGLAVLTEALALAETTGERWHAPELHRLKGGLLLDSPQTTTPSKTLESNKSLPSLDHLVSAQQYRSWDGEAQGLCSLDVDDEL